MRVELSECDLIDSRDDTTDLALEVRTYGRGAAPASACTTTPAGNVADIIAAVESLYTSMKTGAAAVMRVVAADAVFLESGGLLETRAEYEARYRRPRWNSRRRLPASAGRGAVVEGDTAWLNAMTEYVGTFNGTPVDFVSAQLVVMGRADGSWQIRAVHWSSRRR